MANAAADIEQERWALFTKLCLPAVTAARQHVGLTEEIFRTHTFHTMPRQFFLWTALDEVLKTAVFLMKLDGFLGDTEPQRTSPEESEATERVVEALLLEEVRLRERRLCELLVQLVLFSERDDPNQYKHAMLLDELVRAASYNRELDEFHGARSAWVQATIDTTLAELHALEPLVDVAAAWYAQHARPVRADRWPLQSSARARLLRALPQMTDFERLVLGTTYGEAFGTPSESIHYRAGVDGVDHSQDSTVVIEGTKVSLAAMCVMRRIYILVGRPAGAPLETIARALEAHAEGTALLEALNSREVIAVGDFVVAAGYFGQVVEERVSDRGYRSLRVELLAERPLPNLAADWFRVRDVVRIFSKERLVDGVRAALGDPAAVVDDATLRRSALDAWNAGPREDVRR